ncbi:MAG: sulfatase-like hydrolase/transferase [Acidimicrobiia bacterium]
MTTSRNGITPPGFGPWSRELRAFLEFLALTGVAVAQPTFDILSSDGASLLVTRQSGPSVVIAATVAIVLVPPLILWVIEVGIGLVVPRFRRWVHATLAGVVVAVIAIEVAKHQTSVGPSLLVFLGILSAIGGAALVYRFAIAREWLRFLAIAPVVFAVVFLFASPVHQAVFETGNARADDVEVGDPARVVFIAMDELPLQSILDGTGQIDATLFPNFAALAADSTWYRNNTTVASTTEEAIPALLTGDRPDPDHRGPAVAANHPNNLFTLLGGSYEMNVHERITKLCPTMLCPPIAPGGSATDLLGDAQELWTTFASPGGEEAAQKKAGDVTEVGDLSDPNARGRGREFVDSLGSAARSQLDFVHLPLPHTPWHYLPSGQDDGDLDLHGFTIFQWGTEWTAASGRLRHLLQVQYTDRLLGQIMQRLKDRGVYDDSLVVVTADHGVAFNVGDRHRALTPKGAAATTYTPLFVKAPDQPAGRVDDRIVRSIDVVPTIADMLDIDLPWKTDGRSVLGPPGPEVPVEVSMTDVDTLPAIPGTNRARLDADAAFAETLAEAASTSGGDPDLRLYRIGRYGALVGRQAAPLLGTGSDDHTAVVNGLVDFDRVDTGAQLIPWASIDGHVPGLTAGESLAIIANGTVVAVSETFVPYGRSSEDPIFWGNIPPKLLRNGRNTVGIARIVGRPDAPQLVPLQVSG